MKRKTKNKLCDHCTYTYINRTIEKDVVSYRYIYDFFNARLDSMKGSKKITKSIIPQIIQPCP